MRRLAHEGAVLAWWAAVAVVLSAFTTMVLRAVGLG